MRAPTPGRRQSPFQRCLLCRTRAGAKWCAPPRQPRTATCDLSADASHQALARASHFTAAAMRATAESPIPSRPPAARELFPTRVSVAPSGFRQWRRAPLQPRDRSLEVGPGLGINSQVFHGIRTNTTRNPNQKPGPTNCILNSPKSCFARRNFQRDLDKKSHLGRITSNRDGTK